MTSASTSSTVDIVPLEPDQHRAFRAAGEKAFPGAVAAFVRPKDLSLVACVDGDIVGGFTADFHEFSDGTTMAVVRWLFVVPDVQGQGIGAALVSTGLDELKSADVDLFVSDIDGDNTGSFRIAAAKGARLLRPWDQLRYLGPVKTATAWWKLSHFLDFGHYIWAWRSDQKRVETSTSTLRELALSISATSLVAALAAWRAEQVILLVALFAGLFVAFRHLITAGINHLQGLSTTHRAWDSGYLFATVIAFVFSVLFPMPGGAYPSEPDWRASEEVKRRGISSACAVSCMILVVGSIQILLHLEIFSQFHTAFSALLFVGIPFLIFDALLATAPFSCFHASRIRDWSLTAWLVIASTALVAIFSYLFLSP